MSAVIPFQLTISGHGAAGYSLRATAAGRAAESVLELPALAVGDAGTGPTLGRALFPSPVRELLVDLARGADEAGARVQIQLAVTPPELAALPWEWATLGREGQWRPAVREDYTLVRVGRLSHPQLPLGVTGPLRLLIACAPGSVAAAAPLGHALAQPVQAGRLVVDLLRDADPLTLREALAEEPCHALHLVVDDASGLGTAARLRLGRGLDAHGLARLLEDYRDLRLLTLAADRDAEAAALASVAAAVHDDLGLAVVTLGDLDYAQAAMFAGPFYAGLSAGDFADLAATDGRMALESAGAPWGAPRLWVVPGGERLFTEAPAESPYARRVVSEELALRRRSTAEEEPRPTSRSTTETTRRARRPSAEEEEPAVPRRAPVGTPLRPSRRAVDALSRTASSALATARAFVVDATAVGEPAQRPRREGTRRAWLRPQVIALVLACLVLALMVSRVLPQSAEDETPVATPTTLALPTPLPTVVPTVVGP